MVGSTGPAPGIGIGVVLDDGRVFDAMDLLGIGWRLDQGLAGFPFERFGASRGFRRVSERGQCQT